MLYAVNPFFVSLVRGWWRGRRIESLELIGFLIVFFATVFTAWLLLAFILFARHY